MAEIARQDGLLQFTDPAVRFKSTNRTEGWNVNRVTGPVLACAVRFTRLRHEDRHPFLPVRRCRGRAWCHRAVGAQPVPAAGRQFSVGYARCESRRLLLHGNRRLLRSDLDVDIPVGKVFELPRDQDLATYVESVRLLSEHPDDDSSVAAGEEREEIEI